MITPSTSDQLAVLVVDDDPAIRAVVADLLSEEGYRVAVAADGAAGLAVALGDPPALVLTDLAMPGLGGEEVCRRLRADPRTRHVPLIVISALPAHTARARLDGCPHDGYLAKPFDLSDLLATVDRALGAAT